MRVLVTGGSGFIGSHVVDALWRSGHEPRIFDIVRSPYDTETETRIGDILDGRVLRSAMRGCDAVIHLAAVADVNDVVADPTRAELVNASGTAQLLEATRHEGVRRVVYASTIWVYGSTGSAGRVDEDTPVGAPAHLYTATKLAGELYCQAHTASSGAEHVILRFGIPFGPRARPSTVLAAFVARALEGKALTITGSGTQSRQFVFVTDLAEGVVAALTGPANRTYNLVGHERVSVRQIAETVQTLVAPVPIVHVADRDGDLANIDVSGARAAAELGWRATVSFREGAEAYIASLMRTNETPSRSPALIREGSAAAVARQEPGEL